MHLFGNLMRILIRILWIDVISSNSVIFTCESSRAKRVQVSRALPWLFVSHVSHWKCKMQSRVEISFRSFVLRMNETFQQLSRLHTELILIVSRHRDVQFGARLVKCFNYICMLWPQCKKCLFLWNISTLSSKISICVYIPRLVWKNLIITTI